jgi:hypothetical protein
MGSWSDAAVSALQWWFGWIAIGATAIGMLSAIGTLLLRQESSRRQSTKEAERTARLTTTESSLHDAESRLRAAHDRVAKLEAEQKPRRINKSDWPRLLTAANFPPGLSAQVNGVASDPERAQLATDAAEFLRSAGVTTDLNMPLIGGDLIAPHGTVIFTSRSFSHDLTAFRDALIEIGIACEIKPGDFDAPPSFALTIAQKPLPK